MNREFRRYLGYAIGEILLVVAGIFIALQIDTWYQERKEQANLRTYLEGIADDIAGDVQRLEQLKQTRLKTAIEAREALFSLGTVDYLDLWLDEDTVRRVSPVISRRLSTQ